MTVPLTGRPAIERAALIVREFQQKVDQLTPTQLTDPHFYRQQAQSLATVLAQHYFPDANDPFSSLTVPEVVAAVRLAVDDLEQWLLTSLPGSRMLSIKQWQMLQHAAQVGATDSEHHMGRLHSDEPRQHRPPLDFADDGRPDHHRTANRGAGGHLSALHSGDRVLSDRNEQRPAARRGGCLPPAFSVRCQPLDRAWRRNRRPPRHRASNR